MLAQFVYNGPLQGGVRHVLRRVDFEVIGRKPKE